MSEEVNIEIAAEMLKCSTCGKIFESKNDCELEGVITLSTKGIELDVCCSNEDVSVYIYTCRECYAVFFDCINTLEKKLNERHGKYNQRLVIENIGESNE